MLWNFNYREPVTKNRINMRLGMCPELSLANASKKWRNRASCLQKALIPRCEQHNAQNEAKRAETEHTLSGPRR